MARGLIPNEIARLRKVKVFSPNIHAQWQEEENERAFLEWCRKEEPLSPAGIPSRFLVADKTERWLRNLLSSLIP